MIDAVRPFPDGMAAGGKVIYRSLGITDDPEVDFPTSRERAVAMRVDR